MNPTKNFSVAEMACKCDKCGHRADMTDEFMEKIQLLRDKLGVPLKVTSGFRCPDHNAEVSATASRTGPHTTGQAVDFAVSRELAFKMTAVAYNLGFTGCGWKQHSDYQGRFVHLDTLPDAERQPRPHSWSYK